MSIDDLKAEIHALSSDERHTLSAFLVRLELESDPGYWADVRRRMDDKNPVHWINVNELPEG